MLKRFAGRHRTDLILDVIFLVWAAQIIVTGRIMPAYVTHLLHHPAPAAAVSDQKAVPPAPIHVVPDLPET